MGTLEDIKEKARKKVEAEITNTDDYTGKIGMILLSWIEYADNAAGLILTEGKTVRGAFEAMKDYASKHKEGGFACIAPQKALEIILEYFGQPDPQSIIEGGLMYRAMMDEAARFKPYGVDENSSGQNPHPVAEGTTTKNDLSALNALRLEDWGL